MHRPINHQCGFSAVSILIVLVLSGFLLTVALRLIPLYIDNMAVRGALDSLAQDPALATMSKSEVHRKLEDYFYINNVQGEPTAAVSIKETAGTLMVNINYEQRVKLMFNIDAVVVFANQLDANNPDLCCDPQ